VVFAEKNEIKAVEMTRKIRDAHYEQLKGKSAEERIAFYKQKAQAVEARMESERSTDRPAEGGGKPVTGWNRPNSHDGRLADRNE
jgi:hypothetical protein